jgi:hypothetical protein
MGILIYKKLLYIYFLDYKKTFIFTFFKGDFGAKLPKAMSTTPVDMVQPNKDSSSSDQEADNRYVKSSEKEDLPHGLSNMSKDAFLEKDHVILIMSKYIH